MAAKITAAALRAALPTGITISATNYPDSDSALKPIIAILDAYQELQTTQNANNSTPGEDSTSLTVGTGTQTTITRDSSTYNVLPRIYNLSTFLQINVGDAFEALQ